MKTPKPGQFCNINGAIFRAKKRVNGCEGCALNDLLLCPNIVDSRTNDEKPLECLENNIIFVKVQFFSLGVGRSSIMLFSPNVYFTITL